MLSPILSRTLSMIIIGALVFPTAQARFRLPAFGKTARSFTRELGSEALQQSLRANSSILLPKTESLTPPLKGQYGCRQNGVVQFHLEFLDPFGYMVFFIDAQKEVVAVEVGTHTSSTHSGTHKPPPDTFDFDYSFKPTKSFLGDTAAAWKKIGVVAPRFVLRRKKNDRGKKFTLYHYDNKSWDCIKVEKPS